MFPAEKKGEWEPLKVRERRGSRLSAAHRATDGRDDDVTMVDASEAGNDEESRADGLEEEILYEEDPTTEEGAVYPLQSGRVANWSCFFALLTHVYNTLSPPFHTPILIISQPAWTAQDHEKLTQFFFEKFKTPAFCLMDSALAICYAFAISTATIVDVGHGKCDVSTVNDFVVNDLGRGAALARCGGEAMTQRLFDLLSPKGFTMDMCEQLKRSSICEILPPGADLPGENDGDEQIINPSSTVPGNANGVADEARGLIPAQGGGSGPAVDVGDDDRGEAKDGEENDGELDVASIVASGRTSEWVAKKEKEKAEKAAAKKSAADAVTAPKIVKLPNSKRAKVMFHYNERKPLEHLNINGKRMMSNEARPDNGVPKRQKTPDAVGEVVTEADNTVAARKEERRRNRDTVTFVRKDIEVGTERFQAVSGGILNQIADSVHRCILSVPEVGKRSELWDSLIVLGNGSKIKGRKQFAPSSYSVYR